VAQVPKHPIRKWQQELIAALDDAGCSTREIAMFARCSQPTVSRYRKSYGEYRGGRLPWLVFCRVREIWEARDAVRRARAYGKTLADGVEDLALEDPHEVPGIPEDVRDLIHYFAVKEPSRARA
jgi:hypothetical protein